MRADIEYINYEQEKQAREKRLVAYAEAIQKIVAAQSSEVIKSLVEERHRQNLTQADIAEITGMATSNIARFETGTRVPTIIVLQKYAGALGKHIEINLCDGIKE